jgi:hypothetical protein
MSGQKNEIIYQERLQSLAVLAFEVVESLLTDTETPIEIRLNTAFRIVEMCTTGTNQDIGQAIVMGIEKNARDIEKNAHELAYIETLLKKD